MEKKLRILFEVLFVVILCGFYIVKVMIPEYKEKYGSSDTFIKTKNYQNLFEIKIDNLRFAYVYNDKKQIYHILFLTNDAKVLYNRGIENHSIEDALGKSIPILVERDYLNDHSSITITRYGESGYQEFYTSFCSNLEEKKIPNNIKEEKQELKQLANELKLDGTTDEEILRSLDYYSKEITGFLTDEMDHKKVSVEEECFQYTQTIYQKLDNYVHEKNMNSFSRDNAPFPIELIPADEEQVIYPSSKSWYSYEDGKLKAYIEIKYEDSAYGYCYEGSIDSYKKGEC